MTLLDEYNAAADTDFKSKVCAALWQKATDTLKTLPTSDPNYKMLIQFSVEMIENSAEGNIYVSRALASQGLDNNASDTMIITEIENNFDKFARSKDPNAWNGS